MIEHNLDREWASSSRVKSAYMGFLFIVLDRNNAIDSYELKSTVDDMLDTLNPFEKQCLKLRFGLGGDAMLTYSEIAQRLHSTPGTVSKRIRKGIRKLRHPSRSKKLQPLMAALYVARRF